MRQLPATSERSIQSREVKRLSVQQPLLILLLLEQVRSSNPEIILLDTISSSTQTRTMVQEQTLDTTIVSFTTVLIRRFLIPFSLDIQMRHYQEQIDIESMR